MNILFCIATLENDGAERAMSNITTHLPDNVKADILLNSISEHDFPTNARKISLGMKPDSKKGLWYQAKAFWKRMNKLRELKRDNHYDACISFMESANFCNIWTKKAGCKTIVSVRLSIEQEKTPIYKYMIQPVVKKIYNNADYVVAVSEGIRKSLISSFHIASEKVVTITNGYDVNAILTERDKKSFVALEKDVFYFVTVGRLDAQKGHWHLIRAFSKVAKVCPNAKLLIVGQGREKEYLEKLINIWEVNDKVILTGRQNNPFAILSKCQVYVMPSLFEGYSNALCEALICGLPCIATDFRTSAREILAPDTDVMYQNTSGIEYAKYGVITPVCSGQRYQGTESLEKAEELLADAMIRMYEDDDLRSAYKDIAMRRGRELDINKKVEEWLNLVQGI